MNQGRYATSWKQAAPVPSGLVATARSVFRHALLSTLSSANTSLEDSFLRCLYCHYVFDDQRDAFECLLLELKRIGEFVDTATCVQMLREDKVIDGKYYHLSFDDGFRNNYTNALPILQKHKVPCIFFVPSFLVGASYERTATYCSEATGYGAAIEMLNWEDLRDIVSSGYEVGSHTKTHARFSDISRDSDLLRDEILGSKTELEMHLGVECKYISWPYGRPTDSDDASLEATRLAKYRACFSASRGTVRPVRTDIFRIPRHHFEVQWPISHIKYFARGNMEVTQRESTFRHRTGAGAVLSRFGLDRGGRGEGDRAVE